MVIRSFAALEAALAGRPPLCPAVAGAEDPAVIAALVAAAEAGLVGQAVLTGDAAAIRGHLPAAFAGRFRIAQRLFGIGGAAVSISDCLS